MNLQIQIDSPNSKSPLKISQVNQLQNDKKFQEFDDYESGYQSKSQASSSHERQISDQRHHQYFKLDNKIEMPNSKIIRNSQKSSSDEEVDFIIKKVLGNIARKSRRNQDGIHNKNLTQRYVKQIHMQQQKYNSKKAIQKVNNRLVKENDEIRKNIRKIQAKLRKINKKSIHQSINKSGLSEYSQQLNKMKKRLEKAEKINQKMQSELLNESRKEKIQLKKSKKTCEPKSINKTYKILKTDNKSPTKLDYYSPIMQFDNYKLAQQGQSRIQHISSSLNQESNKVLIHNEKTHQAISESKHGVKLIQYEKTNKDRQILQVKSKRSKDIQVAIGFLETVQQQKCLDNEIKMLESKIAQNNEQISLLQKNFLRY